MQKAALHLAILAAPLSVAACATSQLPPPLADARDVALGERAYVDGPIVMPVAILEDSRCPVDFQCVWAGQVRVKMVWIRGNGEQMPFEATLGERTPIADGSILFESVRPEKRAGEPIRREDYRFSLRFDGGL